MPLNVGLKVIANHLGLSSLPYNSVLSTFAGEQATLYDTTMQHARLTNQMDSLLEVYLNDSDWEKVEAPKGAYMSGTTLKQADLREVMCYRCKKTGHIKKSGPLNKTKTMVVVVKVMRRSPKASWRRRRSGTTRILIIRCPWRRMERRTIGAKSAIMVVANGLTTRKKFVLIGGSKLRMNVVRIQKLLDSWSWIWWKVGSWL